jgi:hypothetical protein
MGNMGDLLSQNNLQLLTLSLAGFVIVLFVIVLFLWIQLAKGNTKYKKLLNGASSVNIEQLLLDMQEKLNEQKATAYTQHQAIEVIQTKLTKMKSNVAIHRYNAFGDTGSDLSFSIAILDEHKDGIILSGIHSREMTYIYAKPVEKGASSYSLTPEEKDAINQTVK